MSTEENTEENTGRKDYNFVKVKISDIKIDPTRTVDEEVVKKIAVSIEEIGLIHSITISPDKELITGLHRLKAYQMLGYEEIEAKVLNLDVLRQEMAQLDENLMRKKYHYITEGEMLARRKEIYELLHPETKRGQYGQKGSKIITKVVNADSAISTVPTFIQDIASKINVSNRVLYEEIQIAENLTPEVKKLVKDLDIPKSDALKLSMLEPDQQTEAIQKFTDRECKNLKQAIKFVSRPQEPEERAPPLSAKERVLILLKDSHIEEIEACIADLQRLLEQKKELKELVKEFEAKESEEAEAGLKENEDERRGRKESLDRYFYKRQQDEAGTGKAQSKQPEADNQQAEAENNKAGGD